jgi:hypothetical protein
LPRSIQNNPAPKPDVERQHVKLPVIPGDQDRHRVQEQEHCRNPAPSSPKRTCGQNVDDTQKAGNKQVVSLGPLEPEVQLKLLESAKKISPDRPVTVPVRVGVDGLSGRYDSPGDVKGFEIIIMSERGTCQPQ